MYFNSQGKTLTFLIFLLVSIGLIFLSSAGIIESQKKFGTGYYFFLHQLVFGALSGWGLYLLFSRIVYRFWRKAAVLVMLASLFLVLAVFIPQLGFSAKGATRWLNVGFLFFQPSEVLKFSLIIYLAAWFSGSEQTSAYSSLGRRRRLGGQALFPFLAILGFVALLLSLQPDLGTLSVVVLIALALFFFAGGKTSALFGLGTILAVGFLMAALVSSYQLNRLLAFINQTVDPQGISYHINQALIAIGRGGIWGVGLGQSQQKAGFLPEPMGDSIFAVLMEETGLVGGGILILLFVFLIWQLVKIAQAAPDRFAQLFVLGVAVWIGGQAFVNMAAISGLVPLTGIPLPFISYGSTSLATLLASLGIVANIANQNQEKS